MKSLLMIWTFTLSTVASAAVFDYSAPSGNDFRIWVPDDLSVVYGFYISYNSSGDDNRSLAERETWQGYARSFGFGIIGTNINSDISAAPSDLIAAMDYFAILSGHPEISNAPVVVEGASLGGYLAMQFAADYPERTVAYLSGASGQLAPVDSSNMEAFKNVPGLFYLGEDDGDPYERRDDLLALRAAGAQVGYWIQWGFEHGRFYGNKLGWNFLEEVVRLRYPVGKNPLAGTVALLDIPEDRGWLVDPTTWTNSATEFTHFNSFTGDASEAFWMPTKATAQLVASNGTSTEGTNFIDIDGESPRNENDLIDYAYRSPGAEISVTVETIGVANVTKVELFNGAELLDEKATAPYEFIWQIPGDGIGIHGLNAIATDMDGNQHVGLILPVLVGGAGEPGGGELDPDPDGPPDLPEPPDYGVSDSGCGRASPTQPTLFLALLLAFGLLKRRGDFFPR